MSTENSVDAHDVYDALERELRESEHPVTSAPDVAERLSIGRRQTLIHLRSLEVAEKVSSCKVGSGRAWYIPDRNRGVPPTEPPADTTPEVKPSESPTEVEPPAEPLSEPSAVPPAETKASHSDVVDSLDLPGTESVLLDRRRDAIVAVLNYLDEHGTVGAGELRDELYEEHSAGYKHDRSWWKNFVSPALADLRERGRVELVNKSRGRWKLVG